MFALYTQYHATRPISYAMEPSMVHVGTSGLLENNVAALFHLHFCAEAYEHFVSKNPSAVDRRQEAERPQQASGDHASRCKMKVF